MAPFPSLFINVSDESSVETIRTKISDFCSTISVLDGKSSKKVVVLDEFDGASDQFYKALRGTIEKFAGNTRFIATCNYINKVPDAIQSRFEVIDFNPVNSEEENELRAEWRSRVTLILGKIGISMDNDAMIEFEKSYYPDFRSALNKIQSWMIEGVKNIDQKRVKEFGWSYEDVYKLIFSTKDPIKNYQEIVGTYQGKVDDVMSALGDEFIDWIINNKPESAKIIPAVIVLVAEHQAQRIQVIDPMVSLLSLIFQIQKLVD
jgi:replication factor C small subunit